MYNDYKIYFEKLSMRDRGMLITAIFDYVINGIAPTELSQKADMAFTVISAQLDRDLEKYRRRCAANRANGALGGRPRKAKDSENTDGFSEKTGETLTNTDTYTDTYSDSYTSSYTSSYTESPAPSGTADDGGGGGVTERDFCRFWEAYPKHADRGAAMAAFFEFVRTPADAEELLSLVELWKESSEWRAEDGKWIKRPDKFLTDIFPTRDRPPEPKGSFDVDDFFEAALRRSYEYLSETK